MTLIVEGLVKEHIPIYDNGEIVHAETEFFFGTLTFKLMKVDHDVDITDIDSKVERFSEDPISGIDFILDFLYVSHKAWCMISGKEESISKNQLWLAIDIMGIEKFSDILNRGMKQYGESQDDTTEKKIKKPKPTPVS